jgi:malonyl-CoA O-methyltransferase
MSMPPPLDAQHVRRHFDRAAASYERAAALQREVAARMLERLELVKITPQVVVDAGSGTGFAARALAHRYPAAGIVALDSSLQMLRQTGRARRLWAGFVGRLGASPLLRVCADLARLPFATGSIDLVCSNLALEWAGPPDAVLREAHRVLARGGLLMFTTLGPDTLKELRAAQGARASTVHAFMDMHDLGDLLLHTGFAGPVMDMEHVTLTYPDFWSLVRDLRDSGSSSALASRPRGLRGRAWRERMLRQYERERRDGRLPATFEIVYGHAWKPEQPSRTAADAPAVIRFERSVPRR